MKILFALLGMALIIGSNLIYVACRKPARISEEVFGCLCALMCFFGFMMMIFAK